MIKWGDDKIIMDRPTWTKSCGKYTPIPRNSRPCYTIGIRTIQSQMPYYVHSFQYNLISVKIVVYYQSFISIFLAHVLVF